MEKDSANLGSRNNLIDLKKHRERIENPNCDAEEDLDRLAHIYNEIQKLNNPVALKAATIGCRTAQALIAKKILE